MKTLIKVQMVVTFLLAFVLLAHSAYATTTPESIALVQLTEVVTYAFGFFIMFLSAFTILAFGWVYYITKRD